MCAQRMLVMCASACVGSSCTLLRGGAWHACMRVCVFCVDPSLPLLDSECDPSSYSFIFVRYACEGLAVPEDAPPLPEVPEEATYIPTGNSMPGAPDPTDTSLAFKLHSRPGAPRILLLDFTGYNNTGSYWNTAFGKDSIVTPAYDFDGNPAAFSTSELQNIIKIWRAVAEDYSWADVSSGGGGG